MQTKEVKALIDRLVKAAAREVSYSGGPLADKYRGERIAAQGILERALGLDAETPAEELLCVCGSEWEKGPLGWALVSGPRTESGFALVPIEPTPAMFAAQAPEHERPGDVGTMKYRRGIWKAMLKAASS